jgi:type II secretory ATPase GspE/PulE/Tfp pilus assembly ATPase PilB-like protein
MLSGWRGCFVMCGCRAREREGIMVNAPDARQVLPGSPVTLVLKNGHSLSGTVERFVPEAPDVKISSERGRERIATSEIAYVAFHRGPNDRPWSPAGLEAYKLRLSNGHQLRVLLQPETSGLRPEPGVLRIGFRALPAGADQGYRELYLFNHAVRVREKDERIGEMLVKDGEVPREVLERAIAAQRAGQQAPIGRLLVETLGVLESDLTHALHLQKQRNHRIGEILVQEGLATREQIELATAEQQRRRSKRLGEVLLELKIVDEQVLARTLAKKFELRFVDLDVEAPNPEAIKDVPRELIEKYGMLPVDKTAKALIVAISDPLALEGIDEIRFLADQRVEEVLATASALKRRIAECLGSTSNRPSNSAESGLQLVMRRLDETPATSEEPDDVSGVADPSDSAIVELVNQVIADAYRRGASDIHVEPNGREEDMEIRFRIDGECLVAQSVPARHRHAVVARIKIMAQLDIAERRKPQDGKIRFRLPDRQIELRVATLPTVNGNEDVVMRILAANKPIPISGLQLCERNLKELEQLVKKPYGLILCVGPTGSGKTTTLHSLLGSINTRDTKIWTAEDPVEITQRGLRQVQINPRIGFTFAQAMRAFLRADPDVIMVGEMRDRETASTGVEASLTGHLVFSTLHTNSAPETVSRMLDMGLDPFNFADALLCVLAQRLARRLCAQCRVAAPCSADVARSLVQAYGAENFARDYPALNPDRLSLASAPGCEACGGSGYKGRIGLHELLVASEEIKAAILQRAPVGEIRKLSCAGGMTTLVQDGVQKVLRGETDLKQVFAVCA